MGCGLSYADRSLTREYRRHAFRPAKPDRTYHDFPLQSLIGNRVLADLVQSQHARGESGGQFGGIADVSARPQKCTECASGGKQCSHCEEEERAMRPQRKFFDPEEVPAGGTEKDEDEAKVPRKDLEEEDGLGAVPHAGDATIVCKGGNYTVYLGSWAGKSCGRPDCVTVHEQSHISDWQKRWLNGCKKADGTNQPDGYLPLGGEGYDDFLEKSECDAHKADLECAEKKLKAATGGCKETWKN